MHAGSRARCGDPGDEMHAFSAEACSEAAVEAATGSGVFDAFFSSLEALLDVSAVLGVALAAAALDASASRLSFDGLEGPAASLRALYRC
jgi:hypothetical protein